MKIYNAMHEHHTGLSGAFYGLTSTIFGMFIGVLNVDTKDIVRTFCLAFVGALTGWLVNQGLRWVQQKIRIWSAAAKSKATD